MKRAAKVIAVVLVGVFVIYFAAFLLIRMKLNRGTGVETAAKLNTASSQPGSYPVKIDYGLPLPCQSHGEIMACFRNVVVTTDALGFRIVAKIEKVMVPASSIIGSKRLLYVEGLTNLQLSSPNIVANADLSYTEPGEKGQTGFLIRLITEDSIFLQSDGPGKVTFSFVVAGKTQNGKLDIDSYDLTLNNVIKFCDLPAEIQLHSQVRFLISSASHPGTDIPLRVKSEIDVPIAFDNCSALMVGLSKPLISNPWDKIWTAFQNWGSVAKFGDGDEGDWLSLSATLELPGNDAPYDEASPEMTVSESTVTVDTQHELAGKAHVEHFHGKEFAKAAYILGLKSLLYYTNMPADVIFYMELEAYHHEVTFVGCRFKLGPFLLHPCDETAWP